MARKKKPVDDTPICDPAYVRRIDPAWMPGRVPYRFWQELATGHGPTPNSGPIARAPAETWRAVDKALENGNRGLPGGSSLAKLLRKHGLK